MYAPAFRCHSLYLRNRLVSQPRKRFEGASRIAEVYVVQDKEGNVKAVDVRNVNVGDSSLGKSFMDSIERAVYKSSPLPAAPDEAVFDKELYFIFSVN